MHIASESKCIFTVVTSRTRLLCCSHFQHSSEYCTCYTTSCHRSMINENRKCAFVSVLASSLHRVKTHQRSIQWAASAQIQRHRRNSLRLCSCTFNIYSLERPVRVWSSVLNAERSRGFKEKAASKWFSLSVLLPVLTSRLYQSLHWNMHIKINR